MTALTDFLFPAPAQRRATAIVSWWERRRFHYNVIVGAAGVLSLAVVRVLTWLPPRPHEAVPLELVVIFGVLANVFYTLGPAVEIAMNRVWGQKALPAGPTLFRMGLTFSVGLALLPTLIAGLDFAWRVLRALL